VLFSTRECRALVIDLNRDEQLGEHQVRERAVIQVVSGRVAFGTHPTEVVCEPGTLVTFAPAERHTLRALEPSRILLLLAPWPADGHFTQHEDANPERLPARATEPPLNT
jgi:quercetin dioxygenase-like cupin family protein